MNTPKRKCSLCGCSINHNEEIATILSGTYNNKNDTIDSIKGTLIFHPNCFKEVAGDDYYPVYDPLSP